MSPSPNERLDEIEVSMMHLQRRHDLLDGVVREQQRELAALKRLVARLQNKIEGAADAGEPADPSIID